MSTLDEISCGSRIWSGGGGSFGDRKLQSGVVQAKRDICIGGPDPA